MKNSLVKIFKDLIYITEETSENKLYETLMSLRDDFAKNAQALYNEWDQDENGYDEIYGSGGICDDIADVMCTTVQEKTNYDCFSLYNEYDFHTSIYVFDIATKQIYNVNIPPHVYEIGAGYNWKKIKNVSFNINHINITEVEWDNFLDEDGNIKDDWS